MISPSNTVKLLDKDCSHFKLNLNWSYKEENIHRPRYISCTLTQNFPSTSWSAVFRSALVTRVCFGCFFQDEVDHTFAFGPVCPLLEVDQAKAPLWQGHWHSTIAFINPISKVWAAEKDIDNPGVSWCDLATILQRRKIWGSLVRAHWKDGHRVIC